MSEENEQSRPPYRWFVMVVCTLVGGAGLAATLRYAGDDRHAAAVEFGIEASTSLVLVAVLFILERTFTKKVSDRVANRVREEVVKPLQERVDNLSASLAELRRAGEDQDRQQAEHHHRLIDGLADVSFDSVYAALAEASRLNATGGELTLQANENRDGLWLSFSIVSLEGLGRDRVPAIWIKCVAGADGAGPDSIVLWEQSETVLDVRAKLRDALRQGRWPQPEFQPDWELVIKRLQSSLDLVLPQDNSDDLGWRPAGALYRRIDNDWAITGAGIEHSHHQVVVPIESIPRQSVNGRPFDAPVAAAWEPPCPSWVSNDEWAYVTQVARAEYNARPTVQRRGFA